MALDTLTLSGTSLNDETNYGLEAADFTPPVKRPEWAQAADADGANLIRTPLYENRVITLTVRVGKQASMNAALEKLGALVDLLQEAEKNPEGVPLVWQPANASKSVTFYVLTGAITEIPIVNEGSSAGFYVSMPQVKVMLTCKPFGYGPEETAAVAKSIETGLSTVVLTLPSVPGDVPAEGRLIVKDTAAVGRRFVEWGLENRYYNAATSLILAAESLTPVGGTKSEAANTGAYKPGAGTKLTVATTLLGEPTICANTGVLAHVGSFRVKARCQAVLGSESLAENVKVRLSYQDGEGPLRANEWQSPVVGGKYVELDLGPISLTEKLSGTQKWLGQIEAYSKNTAAADVLHVNYLTFIPTLEGYGKASGPTGASSGTVSAYDNFATGTLSGALNARTPAVGAAWATSGAATDWTVAPRSIARETTGDTEARYALLGAAVGSSMVKGRMIAPTSTNEGYTVGLVARWVNATNYVFLRWKVGTSIQLGVVVAGVTTVLAEVARPKESALVHELNATLTATLDGAITAVWRTQVEGTLSGVSTAVATGGALASGKGGIYDLDGTAKASPRQWTSLSVSTLAGIPYVVQPSQAMEVRSEATIAADSTGTYYGPVPKYRGSRFYVPQKGSGGRTSRILVKADRNDLEESDQQTIGDAFTVEAKVTPRYSVIPR